MKKLLCLAIAVCVISIIHAEKYYCWAIDGSNIRETSSILGKVIGKVDYGEMLEIDLKYQGDPSYFQDLFLIGNEEDGSSDINIKGYWFYVELGKIKGFVYSGYLSRYPTYEISRKDKKISCESTQHYLARNFRLLSSPESDLDSLNQENKSRTIIFDKGIMLIDKNSAKGIGMNYVFSDMTLNEALLFVKFDFNLFEKRNPEERKNLHSSEHYYGQLASYDRYEINFPAPDGKIMIMQFGTSIIISFYGSC